MARTRNIKPGFFTNEILGTLPVRARLLFAGLWTIADRSGRLEDRPRKIKIQVLPCDHCDVDLLLQSLHDHGFILRYEVDGRRYIQITAWDKHQSPHIKEPASTIPAPGTAPVLSESSTSRAAPSPNLLNLTSSHTPQPPFQKTRVQVPVTANLGENPEWDRFKDRWWELTGGDAGRVLAEKYFPQACEEFGFENLMQSLEKYGKSQLWHDGKIHDMGKWFADGKYRETPAPKRSTSQGTRQQKIKEC